MTSLIQDYDPFEIRIRAGKPGHHELEVRSPVGSTTVDLKDRLDKALKTFPLFRRQTLTHPRDGTAHLLMESEIERSPRQARSHWTPEIKGRALFDAIFCEETKDLWQRSLDGLKDGRGLALRFHFDLQDPEQARLAQLPWEQLFDDEQGGFTAQAMATPVVRYLDLPGRVRPFRMPDRLRILGVVSAPKDLDPLGLAPEVDGLRSQWEQDNIEVHILRMEDDTHEDLATRLRAELRLGQYHVLHFMGHGGFDPFHNEGHIYFEDRRRRAAPVPGSILAGWLRNHPSLRLVVLNSCNSGKSRSLERPFTGVAQALIRGGLPGVLAMQEPMPDTDAVAFSGVFYGRLASGSPVEAAVADGRCELHARDPASATWSTPVLYQRAPSIIKMPPKIGPTLTRLWTVFGSLNFILVLAMFFRNRSVAVPVLDHMMTGEVAAFFGLFFGLPLSIFTLYLALQYVDTVKLPTSDLFWIRRLALRFPVTFGARVQGRIANENVYQTAFLLLFIIIPIGLHIHLYADLMRARVWLQREEALFTSTAEENLRIFVPFTQAVFDDNFRIGSIDDRPGIERVINNVTYFPFWQAWGLLIAVAEAFAMGLFLLWKLVEPVRTENRESPMVLG